MSKRKGFQDAVHTNSCQNLHKSQKVSPVPTGKTSNKQLLVEEILQPRLFTAPNGNVIVNWNFVFRDKFDTKERLVDMKTVCPQGKWLAKSIVNTDSGLIPR